MTRVRHTFEGMSIKGPLRYEEAGLEVQPVIPSSLLGIVENPCSYVVLKVLSLAEVDVL